MDFDVIVIGAGMAGASVACELAAGARVLLLEREEQPGYHSTGRSAAAYIPSYGYDKPALWQLTAASRAYLESPPHAEPFTGLLKKRGMLWITRRERIGALQSAYTEMARRMPDVRWLDREMARQWVPALADDYCSGAILEPDVYDIDVHGMLDRYLRAFRSAGGVLHCGAAVTGLRRVRGAWTVGAGGSTFTAPIVVNAGGAWADEVARLADVRPVGLQPNRRTAVLLAPAEHWAVGDWPLAFDHGGEFYFKPDAGLLLVSPADETPSPACDARPEEIDVAYAVHYAEQVLGLSVRSVKHRWAGLRNFVADRSPLIGHAPDADGFFWMAGQGGHGIQIAPAAARLAAALIRHEAVPEDLLALGFEAASVSPARLGPAAEVRRCSAE